MGASNAEAGPCVPGVPMTERGKQSRAEGDLQFANFCGVNTTVSADFKTSTVFQPPWRFLRVHVGAGGCPPRLTSR